MDDNALGRGHRTTQSSSGLRRWAERPCFEDRMLVYLPVKSQDGRVHAERVYATAAVEALGFSEALEALAGLNDEEASTKDTADAPSPTSNTPPLSMTPSTTSLNSLPPSPPVTSASEAASLGYGAKLSANSACWRQYIIIGLYRFLLTLLLSKQACRNLLPLLFA